MNQSNDEWTRTHLDEAAAPNVVASGAVAPSAADDKHFDESVGRVLSANAQCPDALWQTLRSTMSTPPRPSQTFLSRIANRRVFTALLAASVLMAFSSLLTVFFLNMREEEPSFLVYGMQQELETPPALTSTATTDATVANKGEPARYITKTSRIEKKLAAMQAALAQSKKERDLAMTERDEAKTRLKELEKNLVFAQSETETLRSDLALARHETTGDIEGLRQTSGRLNLELDANVTVPGGLPSQHETELYMTSPLSEVSDSSEKSPEANPPLLFDKSN